MSNFIDRYVSLVKSAQNGEGGVADPILRAALLGGGLGGLGGGLYTLATPEHGGSPVGRYLKNIILGALLGAGGGAGYKYLTSPDSRSEGEKDRESAVEARRSGKSDEELKREGRSPEEIEAARDQGERLPLLEAKLRSSAKALPLTPEPLVRHGGAIVGEGDFPMLRSPVRHHIPTAFKHGLFPTKARSSRIRKSYLDTLKEYTDLMTQRENIIRRRKGGSGLSPSQARVYKLKLMEDYANQLIRSQRAWYRKWRQRSEDLKSQPIWKRLLGEAKLDAQNLRVRGTAGGPGALARTIRQELKRQVPDADF